MPDLRCTFEDAVVRPDRLGDLEDLIHKMFVRRHHAKVASGSDQMWGTVELVQALRKASEVYRELSSKMSGPLPFAIGHLRVRDGVLEPVATAPPIDHPEVFVRILSEFLEPGAIVRLAASADDAHLGSDESGTPVSDDDVPALPAAWRIEGIGEVRRIDET